MRASRDGAEGKGERGGRGGPHVTCPFLRRHFLFVGVGGKGEGEKRKTRAAWSRSASTTFRRNALERKKVGGKRSRLTPPRGRKQGKKKKKGKKKRGGRARNKTLRRCKERDRAVSSFSTEEKYGRMMLNRRPPPKKENPSAFILYLSFPIFSRAHTRGGVEAAETHEGEERKGLRKGTPSPPHFLVKFSTSKENSVPRQARHRKRKKKKRKGRDGAIAFYYFY